MVCNFAEVQNKIYMLDVYNLLSKLFVLLKSFDVLLTKITSMTDNFIEFNVKQKKCKACTLLKRRHSKAINDIIPFSVSTVHYGYSPIMQ